MNILISKEFIFEIITQSFYSKIQERSKIYEQLQGLVIPMISSVLILLNASVFFLSIFIYTKTKSKSHQPAMVFIGLLAFTDAMLCM